MAKFPLALIEMANGDQHFPHAFVWAAQKLKKTHMLKCCVKSGPGASVHVHEACLTQQAKIISYFFLIWAGKNQIVLHVGSNMEQNQKCSRFKLQWIPCHWSKRFFFWWSKTSLDPKCNVFFEVPMHHWLLTVKWDFVLKLGQTMEIKLILS